MSERRIAVLLIGHGAIGQYVFAMCQRLSSVRITTVLSRPGREADAARMLDAPVRVISDLDTLDDTIDVAVECAGHQALAQHAPALLRAGIDVLGVSNGALADRDVELALTAAARSGRAQLQLLSGAIGAMDALSAAATGGIDTVVYRGRKPPQGWRGSPAEQRVDLDAVDAAVTHFSGTAREAASAYPKNANVAATIALAGTGLDATQVELIVDPALSGNRHEIEVSGRFGRFEFTIDGKALEGNPRSSALTAMCLVKALQDRIAPVRIG